MRKFYKINTIQKRVSSLTLITNLIIKYANKHTKQANQTTYTLTKPPKKINHQPRHKATRPNTNQPINRINQSTKQTINQSINQPTQTRRPTNQPTCSALRLSASAALSSLVKNLGLAISCSSALFFANSSSITGGVLRVYLQGSKNKKYIR